MISFARPDKIVISTPGPVGLTGYLAARILGIPCVGVYHTDFTKQAEEVIDDRQMVDVVGHYINWFYARMDTVLVPSQYYLTQLADQGHDRARMRLFRRGLDESFRQVNARQLREAGKRWFLDGTATLLYTGRLGKEKNLGLLVDVFERLRADGLPVRLLIVGDGPEQVALEQMFAKHKNDVCFTGRLDRDMLKALYQLSDVLVFPSTTDTFGMSVLEAQTLGLPALVSRCGGPQEIIVDGKTGYALDTTSVERWSDTCKTLVEARLSNPASYRAWRDEIKAAFTTRYTWKSLIDEMTEKTVSDEHRDERLDAPSSTPAYTRQPRVPLANRQVSI